MTRLHWFWRAAIAVIVASAAGTFLADRWVRLLSGRCPVDDFVDFLGRRRTEPFLQAVFTVTVGLAVFGVLSHYLGVRKPPEGIHM